MTSGEPAPEHSFRVRIYYEDTDCMGVVYHANYLRYLERARSEALAASGRTVVEWAKQGANFMVYSVNATFHAPARLGDDIVILSRIQQSSPFRATFEQRIEHEQSGKLLLKAQVDLVCCDAEGKLRQMPELGL